MSNQHSDTSNRGFASMDEEKQREIARKGGHESGGNFANDPERALLGVGKGGHEFGGNFAHDPSARRRPDKRVARLRTAARK